MRTPVIAAAAVMAVCLCGSFSFAEEDLNSRLNRLDAEVGKQTETIREQQKTIDDLKDRLNEQKPVESHVPEQSGKPTGLFGGSLMTNPYVSLVLDAKGYVSNLKNSELESRGVPGFTTEGRGLHNGFNIDAAELFLFAPVDPYFNLYVNIPINEEGVELEEAYFVTTSLPAGFQIKGGRFKSNTSRLNAQHPHAWDFADIALPYKAFLGSEGLGGENGVQFTWLPPLPVYTLLGIEVLQGDSNSLLFGKDDRWGPHAFSAFAKVSLDTSDNSTLYAGPWVLFGSTNSGSILPADEATGNTFNLRGDSALYGLEAVWKWKSGQQGVTVQGEYLYLVQNGDLTTSDPSGAPVSVERLKRHQDGAYIQALYRYGRWRAGARYDRLELFDDTFRVAGVQQQFSGKPWRATGSLEFNPTEFSTIRAQYTHDRSDPGGRVNNEGILQAIFTIGAHPAHTF
ncbi:TonB-dependent receptor [Geobacter sp. SVR]|uniref:TonB-dependent receptor n=1 Tax=Geobacter sp. SVR TaxID=2495594 RepID=UPI00143F0317|nr:TonB-dependent receptor [Geobacter sp. SVR]BCS53212.1 hypothetical protein GSVR_15200 [Geobacter sp. SVR]GCF84597.1 hypothetical protein GSbR_11970 [Geobacter sp. SVR]